MNTHTLFLWPYSWAHTHHCYLASLDVNEPYVHRRHHGLFWVLSGVEIQPHSLWNLGFVLPILKKKIPIFFFFFWRLWFSFSNHTHKLHSWIFDGNVCVIVIDKPKALRRDCIYNNEKVLEIYASCVYLHSTYIVLWHTQMFQLVQLMLRALHPSFEMKSSEGHYSEVVVHL